MSKTKTAVQVVTGIMNSSPLAQAFVLEAISAYSGTVIEHPPAPDPKAIIPSETWVATARSVQADLQKHYRRKP